MAHVCHTKVGIRVGLSFYYGCECTRSRGDSNPPILSLFRKSTDLERPSSSPGRGVLTQPRARACHRTTLGANARRFAPGNVRRLWLHGVHRPGAAWRRLSRGAGRCISKRSCSPPPTSLDDSILGTHDEKKMRKRKDNRRRRRRGVCAWPGCFELSPHGCSKCRCTHYAGLEHMRLHRPAHKLVCVAANVPMERTGNP